MAGQGCDRAAQHYSDLRRTRGSMFTSHNAALYSLEHLIVAVRAIRGAGEGAGNTCTAAAPEKQQELPGANRSATSMCSDMTVAFHISCSSSSRSSTFRHTPRPPGVCTTDILPPFALLCLAHTGCVAVCAADSSSSGRSSSSSRRLLEGNAAVATQAAATAQAAAAAKTAAASQAAAASKPASSTATSATAAAGKPAGTGQPRVGVAAGHPAFSAGGIAQDLAHISADNQVTKQGGHTGHKRKQHIHVIKGGYTTSPTPPSDYASTTPASPEEDVYAGKDDSKDKSEESADESTESKKDPSDSDNATKPKAPTVKKIVKKKKVRFRV